MKQLLEKIYLRSPGSIQNTLISIYGMNLHISRLSGKYKYYYCKSNQRVNDRNELDQYILIQLHKIITEAANNVPYYRELFSKNDIKVDDIHAIEDIAKIPLLEKEKIRKAPEEFINTKYRKSKIIKIHTTGTTGTPLKIFCSNEVRQLNYAFYNRFLDSVGIQFKGKRATIGGRIIIPVDQSKPPFWRYSIFQKNLLMSSYHLTEANLPYYIEKIRTFCPDYIDAYPSSLFVISDYARRHSIEMHGIVKGITTSGETLLDDQRRIIESTFGVPIFDQYGATEMCVFIGQCINGSYHIHDDYAVVEFLKDDGTIAKSGEEAEIVCTSLINPVMPLIRYRIGDRAICSDRKCTCGSHFPVVDIILGRTDDYIITPDGRSIGRLSPVLKGFPIKEARYIQERTDEIVVEIVKDAGYESETEQNIVCELRKRIGHQMTIRFEYVEQIKRAEGGKLRTVIKRCG